MVDSAVGNKYAIDLCNALGAAGVDVTLVSVEDIEEDNFHFNFLPYSPSKRPNQNKVLKFLKYFIFIFWLLKFIKKMNFDVVHFQFLRRIRMECLIFPLLSKFQKNIVFTAHNIVPHENGKLDYWLRALVYRNVSKIIVHRSSIKANLLKAFKINPSKIYIVPHINPLPKAVDQMISQECARKKLDLINDDLVILFFGYIRPYKGVDLLLAAFDDVVTQNEKLKSNSNKNVQLLIAGKPMNQELENEFLSTINEMSEPVKKNVKTFFHFIEEDKVEVFFRAADLVALPYRHIDYSAVSDRASLYAKPVITTNVGDFKSTIAQKGIGFVSDTNDLDSFSQTLKLALQNVSKLKVMGTKAYQLFVKENSHKKIAVMTLETYNHIT